MGKTSRLATLVAVFFSLVLHAQQGTTVRGRVTIASDGSPVPGVTVSIDESDTGGVTPVRAQAPAALAAAPAPQTPIQPGDLQVTTTVHVVWSIQ